MIYKAMVGDKKASSNNFIPRLVDKNLDDIVTQSEIYTFIESKDCYHNSRLVNEKHFFCVDCGLSGTKGDIKSYDEKKKFLNRYLLDFKAPAGKYTYILPISSIYINLAKEILDIFGIYSSTAYEEHNVLIGNFSIKQTVEDYASSWKTYFNLVPWSIHIKEKAEDEKQFSQIFHHKIKSNTNPQ